MYSWGDAAPSARHLNACGPECARWLGRRGASEGVLHAEDDGWAATAPVGSFLAGASPFGALDMVGNVWEWVADRYGTYEANDADDPRGPLTGDARTIRGGAWNGARADWVRPTFRYASDPETRSHGIGFRCARAL